MARTAPKHRPNKVGSAEKPSPAKPEPVATSLDRPKPPTTPLIVHPDGRTEAEVYADQVFSPTILNGCTAYDFGKLRMSEPAVVDLNAIMRTVTAKVEAVQRGDLRGVDEMLVTQTLALNGVFSEMMRLAKLNMGHSIDGQETYIRLGLKAQAQCRATLQTIAEMKNPRPVYVQQANIAHGPQQVNNDGATERPHALPSPREAIPLKPSNKLLETENDERLDAVPARKAG